MILNLQSLIDSLKLLLPLVAKRSTIPILTHVRIAAIPGTDIQKGSLLLIGTDLEVGIIVATPMEIGQELDVCVPLRQFTALLGSLDGLMIELSRNGYLLAVKCGSFIANLPLMDSANFPEIPTAPFKTVTLPGATLARFIRQTSFAISKEESRFTLNGALLSFGEQAMIATDGYRLAIASGLGVEDQTAGRHLVGKLPLEILASWLTNQSVEFAADNSHQFFILNSSTGTITLVARKLTGNFPDYQRVLKDSAYTGTVEVSEILAFLRSVALFTDTHYSLVRLAFVPGRIAITGESLELGSAECSVTCLYDGPEITVALNAIYLIGALTAVQGLSAKFGVTNSTTKVEISDDNYRCVIMPLRTGRNSRRGPLQSYSGCAGLALSPL